ncbi:MAG: DUF4112 domain-containing protein [Bacteroidota bacterium]
MSSNRLPDLPVLTEAQRAIPQLRWVDGFSRLLDTKFRIPGTDVRFGLDFIMGLVPAAGSFLSLAFSGVLIATMFKHGASGMLTIRMFFNVLLDAVVGSIPLLGNLFDLFYKANYRNLELMKEYYHEGEHQGSAWPVVIGLLILFFVLIAGVIYGVLWLLNWLFTSM